ncbi:MAG: UPF0179 family protein [Methanomassiliicoccales archaeon]
MVNITLIGVRQAKEGVTFIYKGFVPECRDCKLKAVCFNLDPGGIYRVKAVRDVRHDCKIHDDAVQVVEVEKLSASVAIAQKFALEGSTITYDEVKCKNLGCVNFRLCHPQAIERGGKYKIKEVKGELECPEGNKVIEVVVE